MRKQAPTVTSKIGYKKKGHVLINSLQEKKQKQAQKPRYGEMYLFLVSPRRGEINFTSSGKLLFKLPILCR